MPSYENISTNGCIELRLSMLTRQTIRICILTCAWLVPLVSQAPSRKPLTLPLACADVECPLLNGPPRTASMRSGFVRLAPGQSVGWHSTGHNEESLVILHGKGDALIGGGTRHSFTAPGFVYIPPDTRHNVTNTGHETLEYVFVVAAAHAD